MSHNVFFVSDTHFGHANIIKFTDNNGNRIRPFDSIEEHDETLVRNWNSVVQPNDRVYHLGDVVINRKFLPILGRLNGRKKLVKGNHDIFNLKDYAPYFEDILAYRVFPKEGIICSHIPVHVDNLERFPLNVHGHTHSNFVKTTQFSSKGTPDPRYLNICVEHTNWTPVSFDFLLTKVPKAS